MHASTSSSRSLRQTGFTLIELMVAMTVGLVVIIALMAVTRNYETSKRQVQGNAVMGQNIGFVSYDLDRQLRTAGSGFLSSARDNNPAVANAIDQPDLTAYRRALGCTLNVTRSGTQILPRTTAFAAPFASVPLSVRLIPALIHAGIGANGSDVLAIIGGTSGVGEVPIGVRPNGVTFSQVDLLSSVGIKANDLMLMIETGQPCMMTQVASTYASTGTNTAVTLGGTYYAATSGSVSLSGYATGLGNPANYPGGFVTSVLLFGNASGTTPNYPQMRLYGVDTDHQLKAVDLLGNDNGGAVYPAAENVRDMRALYGLDTDFDGIVDTWVQPTGSFTVAALTAGTAAAQNNLMQIRAIRVAMLVHSDRIEKTNVSPTTFTLFGDLATALQTTVTISGTDLQRHFKVVDFTVPLRNAQQLPVIDSTFTATPISQIVP
ncbi:PilW family protein [Burkholderiaceae bacterium UC74_6]